MPEPTTAKLVDKKTAAYEKQQAEVEEESRMKSLEQLVGTLMNNGKSSDTGEKEKDGDRLQQSVNTYEQISGQLDDFYETPKETASGDLERKVDELNKKLEEAEKEKSKAATREELMERSYRMAAKYLNPDKDTVREKAVGEEPGSCSGSAGGESDDFRPFTTCYGFRFYRFAHCREELRF